MLGRFTPAWCDIGFWSKQRQAFSWHFGQMESTARWTILLDAGGKLTVDELDMQTSCSVGLYVRGSDAHTGPDETRINFVNIDESAPNDCLLVKVDPNLTGTLPTRTDADTGVITTHAMHSVRAGDVLSVSWSGGQRYYV